MLLWQESYYMSDKLKSKQEKRKTDHEGIYVTPISQHMLLKMLKTRFDYKTNMFFEKINWI